MEGKKALAYWRQRLQHPLRRRWDDTAARWRSRALHLRDALLRQPAVALVVDTVREVGQDNVAHMAAGIAYYAIFSLFPLLLGLLALFSFFLDEAFIRQQLTAFLAEYIPSPGVRALITETLSATLRLRGTLGVVSIVALFWAASGVFGAISRSVNRAWDVERDRPFYIAKLRHIGMAVGVGALFLLSFVLSSLVALLQEAPLLAPELEVLRHWGVAMALGLLPLLLSFLIFAGIFKFVPNTATTWRAVLPGAFLTAAVFEAVKRGFLVHLGTFANYEQTYGGGVLRDVVVFLFWVYLSAFILLVGAEFTAEVDKRVRGLRQAGPQSDRTSAP